MNHLLPTELHSALLVASNATLGLLVGALLAEGCLLVPYWRTLRAQEFHRLHPIFGPRLFRFFAPLTTVPVVLSLATSLALWGTPRGPGSLVASAFVVSLLLFYFVYFHRANARLASGTLDEHALSKELRRWQLWHRARVAVGLVALLLSLGVLAA